jgi:ABC-type transport system substrate-binding protein/tRNA A-37 threonylcarbamoyl transferase component Bud32
VAAEAGLIGQTFSERYEIVGELGRGGMGVVYRAHDPVLHREVALKVIPPDQLNKETEQRFQQEARLVAQMDHPTIVPVYDFGRHESSLFLVMPVVSGKSLRYYLEERALLLGDALEIGIQAAQALEYSHGQGVVHRDIKPENIMVAREEDGRLRVRVMDFGLARVTTNTKLTKTGVFVGTMAYFSPEQVVAREISAATDIYALGTVLYESVVGKTPFAGELQSVLYRIAHEQPESPRSLGVDIDAELEEVILSCLAKDPEQRPSAGKLAKLFRGYRSRLRDSVRDAAVMLSDAGQAHRPVLAPFVGREKELTELQQRLNAAVGGECQFVVVGGEAGIGKTRILDELENLASARDIRVLHGRFVEQDRSFPYQGFCEVIQEYFRRRETGSSAAELPDFSDVAPELGALFPMLAEISQFRATAQAAAPPGSDDRTRIFEVLARTITRAGAGLPLVLLLEDLHEADVSVEALQYIVRRLGPTPTLIVGTYRTTDVDRRHPLTAMIDTFRGDRRFASVTLEPLTRSEHRRFLETLVGGPLVADALAQRLFEGTEGNAFFTKELVRSLLESGGIDKDPTGTWRLSRDVGLTTDALPATIQQAVETRLDRLPEELHEILTVAAVLGRTFDNRDLEALAGDARDVDDAVDQLIGEGLIEEERKSRGEMLTFASGVVRDVLYGQISRRKRRSLHRKCAQQLEKRLAGRLERIYPDLLYHFSEGDVPDRTVEYGLLLAQGMLDSFSPEEAGRAAKAALDFLDDEWEGDRSLEGDARLLLARAHRMAGDLEASLRQCQAAVGVLERENAPTADALLLAADTAWHARRPEVSGQWIERGIPAARAEERTETLQQLLALATTHANLRGEYARAREFREEAQRLKPAAPASNGLLVRGGRLVVPFAGPVAARQPWATQVREESEVLSCVFETLLATDRDGNLIPGLAESWQMAADGRSLLLTLRDGVRFHDGSLLDAHEVKRSFELSIAHKLRAAHTTIVGVEEFKSRNATEVTGLVVRSERELEIRLAERLPIYPALLTDPHTAIAKETPQGQLVGTGAFRMASQTADKIVVERNEDLWREEAALDAIEFHASVSPAAIAAGLRSGEFDVVRGLPRADREELLRDHRFRDGLVETPAKGTFFVLFNALSGPTTKNRDVRRALAGIVHPRDLVWRTVGADAQPACGFIPPGIPGHDPGRRRRPLSVEEATEMLERSGAASPLRLKAAVLPRMSGSVVDRLFATWAELGVEVTVEASTMGAFLEAVANPEGLDIVLGGQNADYDDPDFFAGLFQSRAGSMRGYFASDELDGIIEEARTETRTAQRASLYRKFESVLTEEGVLLPLYHNIDYRIAGPRVRGLKLRNRPPYVNYGGLKKVETAAPAEVRPRPTGILKIPLTGSLTDLDPALSSTSTQTEVLQSVFEPLTRDVGGAQIAPHLAAEIRTEDGGRRYRIQLREDIRFHDGRRLTARDVRYSYERLLQDPACVQRWVLFSVKGAKALMRGEAADLEGFRIHSSHAFTIELNEPASFFPAVLSYTATAIVPEGSNPAGTSWKDGCVGTGPYRVVSFEPGQRVEVERHPAYWRKGLPRNAGVTFSLGVSPEEILAGFRADRYSLAAQLHPKDWEELRRDPAFASGYRETPQLAINYLAFNIHSGPLRDPGLRRALVQAADVNALVRETLGRFATPAHGLIPPGLLGHDPAGPNGRSSQASSERPADDLELSVITTPTFTSTHRSMTQRLWQSFGDVGVRIRVEDGVMGHTENTDMTSADLALGGWIADYPDTDSFVYGLLHSRHGMLGRLCGHPAIDKLAERGRAEPDPRLRHAMYREVEDIVARESLLLPLFYVHVYRFARPEIDGLALSQSPEVAYENLRLKA